MIHALRLFAVVCLLGVAPVAGAREDSVQLKSGNVLTGTILEIGDETIRLRTRGSLETYVGFTREISLVRRLPEDKWHGDALPKLLQHYYTFNSLKEAERAFRASLK